MKLLAYASVFILVMTSSAQEQLTCLRTGGLASRVVDDGNGEELRGPPGKAGRIGEKGEIGEKGRKGEAGVFNMSVADQLREEISAVHQQQLNSNKSLTDEISLVQEEVKESIKSVSEDITSMQQQLREATRSLAALRRGYARLGDGWIGLYNGYQYKRTTTRQNYEESKTSCQAIGAKLASYGVQDIENRRKLKSALNFGGSVWIGLDDLSSEGSWQWENEERASDVTALWGPGEPAGGDDEDCARIWFGDSLFCYDAPCTRDYFALCEKTWEE